MLVDRKQRAREASVAGVAEYGQDAAERHLHNIYIYIYICIYIYIYTYNRWGESTCL